MAHLVGISDKVKGQKFEINRNRTTIGRTAGANDIAIDEPTISANHCYISRRANRYVIRDLNSTNGTMVDSERITECELEPKQVVKIGGIEFMFESDETPPSTSTSSPEKTQVMTAPSPAAAPAPKSFASVSPFGAKRKETKKSWLFLVVMVGLVALATAAYLVMKLMALSKA